MSRLGARTCASPRLTHTHATDQKPARTHPPRPHMLHMSPCPHTPSTVLMFDIQMSKVKMIRMSNFKLQFDIQMTNVKMIHMSNVKLFGCVTFECRGRELKRAGPPGPHTHARMDRELACTHSPHPHTPCVSPYPHMLHVPWARSWPLHVPLALTGRQTVLMFDIQMLKVKMIRMSNVKLFEVQHSKDECQNDIRMSNVKQF